MRTEKTIAEKSSAALVNRMLERHPEITQGEIARRLGFKETSQGVILTQIKHGRTKMPFKHIGPLCKLLNEDPRPLIATVMKEYYSDVLDTLVEHGILDEELLEFVVDLNSADGAPLFPEPTKGKNPRSKKKKPGPTTT